MIAAFPSGAYRRYLIRISYDGSRFPEMAKSDTGRSLMTFVGAAFRVVFPMASGKMKLTQASRTDSGVHARCNALGVQVPAEGIGNDKKALLIHLNTVASDCVPGGITFLDLKDVSDGFCVRRHALYRHYKYRLLVARNENICQGKFGFSLSSFAERNYAWLLPNGFDPYKASYACQLLKGTHNLASFMKYSLRDQRKNLSPPFTIRRMYDINIDCGYSKYADSEGFDCYEISMIAKSFLRGQVRRMVSVIVGFAYGRITLDVIKSLLVDPRPEKFHYYGFFPAPACGLCLENVVYDEKTFLNPIPYIHGLWSNNVEATA